MTELKKPKKPLSDRHDRNADPITNEPGAHPVGVGIGAAAAGAVTGAAAGALAGPIGAAVGVVAGAVAGGLGGKAVAESIDPTEEDAYWRENYPSRPYYDSQTTYDEFGPAYRYGWESRERFRDREFADIETDLSKQWGNAKAKSRLGWEKAKLAARDAWDRAGRH